MSRSTNSADALIEILQMCEQTLAAIAPDPKQGSVSTPLEKSRNLKLHQSRKRKRPFVLIRGGLLRLSQKIARR